MFARGEDAPQSPPRGETYCRACFCNRSGDSVHYAICRSAQHSASFSVPLVKLYRRILRYVRPYRAVFSIAIVGMLVVAGTDLLLLQGLTPLLRSLQTPGATPGWYFALGIVGVFVLRGIGSYASEFGLAWIGSRVVFDLRCDACDHLLRMPASFFDATSAGILLSKITFDAQQISSAASEAITVSIRNTLT